MTSGEAFTRLLTVAEKWSDAGDMLSRARDVRVLGWEGFDLGADTDQKKPRLRQLFAACGVDPMAMKFTADELARPSPVGPNAYGRLAKKAGG